MGNWLYERYSVLDSKRPVTTDMVWVVAPPAGADSWLKDLCDLSRGEVFSKSSSYVEEQNEVMVMIEAVKSDDHWPGGFYEKLQNALDNNDWSKGPVEINIFTDDPDNPITYLDYLKLRQQGINPKVSRIDIVNNIKDGRGLRPGHVTLTMHEQAEDANTQGTHGRGLSITTTADIAGGLAQSVTFSSYHPDIGSWMGQAQMVADPVDGSLPSSLTLFYKRDTDHQIDKTTISIHSPNEDNLEALANLPNWYLPFNPKYQFNRMGNDDIADRCDDAMVVFVKPGLASGDHQTQFDSVDLWPYENGGTLGADISGDPMRAEVLSPEVIDNCPAIIDFVFVDGLRVRVPGAKMSNIYSFYGWKNAKEGANPHRSNDSREMNGQMDSLLCLMLSNCDNVQTWERLLLDGFEGKDRHELKLPYSLDLSGHKVRDQVKGAFTKAWSQICQDHGYNLSDDLSCVANTDSECAEALRVGLHPVLLESDVLVRNLSHLGIMKTANSLTAEVNARIQAKQAEQIRERDDVLLAERRKADMLRVALEALELKKRGIKEVARTTGEVVLVDVGEPEICREQARLGLEYLMVMNGGGAEREGNNLVITMRADDFSRVPKTVDDLGPVKPFVMSFLAVQAASCNVEVRVVKNGVGAYFVYDTRGNLVNGEDDSMLEIMVFRGATDMVDENLLQITLSPNRNINYTIIFGGSGEIRSWERMISASLDPFRVLDGRVSIDKYLASSDYKDYPFLAEVIRARLQMNQVMAQRRRQALEINEHLKRAGLPLIDLDGGSKVGKPKKVKSAPEKLVTVDSGVSIHERVLQLLRPNERTGLITVGRNESLQMVMEDVGMRGRLHHQLTELVEAVFKQTAPPQMQLSSGFMTQVPNYLISHLNPMRGESETMLEKFGVTNEIGFGLSRTLSKLKFGYAVGAGLKSLYFPPGFKPIGYYHPSGEQPIVFSTDGDETHWAFNSDKRIPPGLVFYYERDGRVDTSVPPNRETVANRESVGPEWRNLIDAINGEKSLTDKQKLDILITSWVRAFHYNESQETFDLYQLLFDKGPEFVSKVIYESAGNCGYAAIGLYGLCWLTNIPAEIVNSYLTDEWGAASLKNNLHGLVQPYVDGRRVYVEPQQGYITDGYTIGPIPVQFESLINSIRPSSERFHDGQVIEAVTERAPTSGGLVAEFMVGILSAAKTINFRPPVNMVKGPKRRRNVDQTNISTEVDRKLRKGYLRRSLVAADVIGGLTILVAKSAPNIIEALTRLNLVTHTETYTDLDTLVSKLLFGITIAYSFGTGVVIDRMVGKLRKKDPPVEKLGENVVIGGGDD